MKATILKAHERRQFGKGASFSLPNRLVRLCWTLVWTLTARWTPGVLSPWRVFLLNAFGAQVSRAAAVAPSARIWLPGHLAMGPNSTLGPDVDCYNMAPISIGARTIISQGAFLCAGTHDIRDPAFQLLARPISIGSDAWIAAQAFIAPGVTVGDGCVIAARACIFEDTRPWTVYRGNPATAIKARILETPSHRFSEAG
jgi:putative colanic acid biosynthesis acetyltransferase WcaF